MKTGSQLAVETKISPFSLIKMSLLTPVYLVVQHFFLTFLIYWLSIRDRTISEQQNFQNSVPNDQNLKYSFWWINLGLFWISNFDQDKILVLQNYSKLYLCNFRINCQYSKLKILAILGTEILPILEFLQVWITVQLLCRQLSNVYIIKHHYSHPQIIVIITTLLMEVR